MNPFVIVGNTVLLSQYPGNPSGPIGRKLINHRSHFFHKVCIGIRYLFRNLGRIVDIRPMVSQNGAQLSDAHLDTLFFQGALQGQDSLSSGLPHRVLAFFSTAFST